MVCLEVGFGQIIGKGRPNETTCPNPACPDYGKLQNDPHSRNLKKLGFTRKGVQRYPCKTCGKTFTEIRGTLFFHKHASMEPIVEVLALVAKGIQEDTILRWLREAAQHMDELNEVLMHDFHLKRAQIDGLWSFVQKKGNLKPQTAPPSGSRP